MRRAAVWLLVVALLIGAHMVHTDSWRAACLTGALVLFGLLAPGPLRAPTATFVVLAALLGIGLGVDLLLDALPAMIAALVGWLFARTLLGERRPLIARAIAVLDGEQPLDDPQVSRYARRLTWLWSVWQGALACVGVLVVLRAHDWLAAFPVRLPGPAIFGALVLPLGVALLFLAEFFARPYLLRQAPRHRLWPFVKNLLGAWPRLIDD